MSIDIDYIRNPKMVQVNDSYEYLITSENPDLDEGGESWGSGNVSSLNEEISGLLNISNEEADILFPTFYDFYLGSSAYKEEVENQLEKLNKTDECIKMLLPKIKELYGLRDTLNIDSKVEWLLEKWIEGYIVFVDYVK